MKEKLSLLAVSLAACSLSPPNSLTAQEYDLFDPQASLVHVSKLHALYAGLSQAININCGGNVDAYADRFVRVFDTLPEHLKPTYGGMFGEAIDFGEAYNCNRQKLTFFSEWENMYFSSLINR